MVGAENSSVPVTIQEKGRPLKLLVVFCTILQFSEIQDVTQIFKGGFPLNYFSGQDRTSEELLERTSWKV